MHTRFRTAFLGAMLIGIGVAHAEEITLEVEHVSVQIDKTINQPVMQLDLTAASGMVFGEFTTRHTGQGVDLRVDDQTVMSPRIMEPILGGKIMVSGSFATGELETMAKRIEDKAAKVTVRSQDN